MILPAGARLSLLAMVALPAAFAKRDSFDVDSVLAAAQDEGRGKGDPEDFKRKPWVRAKQKINIGGGEYDTIEANDVGKVNRVFGVDAISVEFHVAGLKRVRKEHLDDLEEVSKEEADGLKARWVDGRFQDQAEASSTKDREKMQANFKAKIRDYFPKGWATELVGDGEDERVMWKGPNGEYQDFPLPRKQEHKKGTEHKKITGVHDEGSHVRVVEAFRDAKGAAAVGDEGQIVQVKVGGGSVLSAKIRFGRNERVVTPANLPKLAIVEETSASESEGSDSNSDSELPAAKPEEVNPKTGMTPKEERKFRNLMEIQKTLPAGWVVFYSYLKNKKRFGSKLKYREMEPKTVHDDPPEGKASATETTNWASARSDVIRVRPEAVKKIGFKEDDVVEISQGGGEPEAHLVAGVAGNGVIRLKGTLKEDYLDGALVVKKAAALSKEVCDLTFLNGVWSGDDRTVASITDGWATMPLGDEIANGILATNDCQHIQMSFPYAKQVWKHVWKGTFLKGTTSSMEDQLNWTSQHGNAVWNRVRPVAKTSCDPFQEKRRCSATDGGKSLAASMRSYQRMNAAECHGQCEILGAVCCHSRKDPFGTDEFCFAWLGNVRLEASKEDTEKASQCQAK